MPECTVDNDCPFTDKCHLGSCINACVFAKCGSFAVCQAEAHDSTCYCIEGYSGNPQTACYPRKIFIECVISFPLCTCENCLLLVAPSTVAPITAGCDNNNECPSHTACRNRLCINPCAQDDPCASNAICRVANHQPICTCPDGFVGDPTISCELRNLQS